MGGCVSSDLHEALDRIEGLQRELLTELRSQSLRLDNADERTRGLQGRLDAQGARIDRLERRVWWALALAVAALAGCVLAVVL